MTRNRCPEVNPEHYRLFRIPDYQRGYAWKHEQLADFWDDLLNLHEGRYHYTGLLSLKAISRSAVSWQGDEWLIDIGPFFDRFGATKMAVLTSSDVGVQAIIKDTQIRKWLDLKLPEIASALAYIGTKIPEVTPELQQSILNTPVEEKDNLALRKLYFS